MKVNVNIKILNVFYVSRLPLLLKLHLLHRSKIFHTLYLHSASVLFIAWIEEVVDKSSEVLEDTDSLDTKHLTHSATKLLVIYHTGTQEVISIRIDTSPQKAENY